jgi:hypothetical protein
MGFPYRGRGPDVACPCRSGAPSAARGQRPRARPSACHSQPRPALQAGGHFKWEGGPLRAAGVQFEIRPIRTRGHRQGREASEKGRASAPRRQPGRRAGGGTHNEAAAAHGSARRGAAAAAAGPPSLLSASGGAGPRPLPARASRFRSYRLGGARGGEVAELLVKLVDTQALAHAPQLADKLSDLLHALDLRPISQGGGRGARGAPR